MEGRFGIKDLVFVVLLAGGGGGMVGLSLFQFGLSGSSGSTIVRSQTCCGQ